MKTLFGLLLRLVWFWIFNHGRLLEGAQFPPELPDRFIQSRDGSGQPEPLDNPHETRKDDSGQEGEKDQDIGGDGQPLDQVEKIQLDRRRIFQRKRDNQQDQEDKNDGVNDFHISSPKKYF
jgi:hypothetical protein